MQQPQHLDDIVQPIQAGAPVLLYISGQRCTACTALKPKIAALSEKFPRLRTFEVASEKHPAITGYFGVFTAPTLLVFFEGKEYFREGRNISVSHFEKQLQRIYSLWKGIDGN